MTFFIFHSILNIRSFAAGFNPWGDSWRHPASISDKKFEVLAFSQQQFANMYLSNGTGERLAQCSELMIKINHPMAIQIDGEAIMLDKVCTLKISHRNQHRVLIKQKHPDNDDVTVDSCGDMTRVSVIRVVDESENGDSENFVESPLGTVELPLDLDLETIRPKIERLLEGSDPDFYYVDLIRSEMDQSEDLTEESPQGEYNALEKSRELTLLRDFLGENGETLKIRTDLENCLRAKVASFAVQE